MSEPQTNDPEVVEQLHSCQTCGTIMPNAVSHEHFGPMVMTSTRRHCWECEYKEAHRLSRLVKKKPYKDPFPQPTKDGKMPEDLKRELQTKQQQPCP